MHASVVAHPNIALVKYWGKREQKLILPINSSVSVTIDQADLATTTTVTASATYARDRLWLNGEEEDITDNKRVQRVLAEIRARAGDLVDEALHLDLEPEYGLVERCRRQRVMRRPRNKRTDVVT